MRALHDGRDILNTHVDICGFKYDVRWQRTSRIVYCTSDHACALLKRYSLLRVFWIIILVFENVRFIHQYFSVASHVLVLKKKSYDWQSASELIVKDVSKAVKTGPKFNPMHAIDWNQLEWNWTCIGHIFFPSRKWLSVACHNGQCMATLRPRQNGRHFADDIYKCISLNENVWIQNNISLKFVRKGPINNIPALVQVMAWRRPGDKPLSEPMMVSLTTHICVTRPQWVNTSLCLDINKYLWIITHMSVTMELIQILFLARVLANAARPLVVQTRGCDFKAGLD